jgi:hypothetical protein
MKNRGIRMTQAKVDLTLGALSFSGEGQQEWLGEQLDKILEAAPGLANLEFQSATVESAPPGSPPNGADDRFNETLADYIRSKGGDALPRHCRLAAKAG